MRATSTSNDVAGAGRARSPRSRKILTLNRAVSICSGWGRAAQTSFHRGLAVNESGKGVLGR